LVAGVKTGDVFRVNVFNRVLWVHPTPALAISSPLRPDVYGLDGLAKGDLFSPPRKLMDFLTTFFLALPPVALLQNSNNPGPPFFPVPKMPPSQNYYMGFPLPYAISNA